MDLEGAELVRYPTILATEPPRSLPLTLLPLLEADPVEAGGGRREGCPALTVPGAMVLRKLNTEDAPDSRGEASVSLGFFLA